MISIESQKLIIFVKKRKYILLLFTFSFLTHHCQTINYKIIALLIVIRLWLILFGLQLYQNKQPQITLILISTIMKIHVLLELLNKIIIVPLHYIKQILQLPVLVLNYTHFYYNIFLEVKKHNWESPNL